MKKIICLILLLLLIYFFADTFARFLLKPEVNKFKFSSINGTIRLENYSENSLLRMYVYYPYFATYDKYSDNYPLKLCSSIINWDNGVGTFDLHFSAPVGLKNVWVTPKFRICDYKEISLEDKTIEFVISNENCTEQSTIDFSKENLLYASKRIIGDLTNDIFEYNLNVSSIDGLFEDKKRSEDAYFDSETSDDINNSYNSALLANFFAKRAKYRYEVYQLNVCLNNIEILLEQNSNDCFVPDYLAYQMFNSSKEGFEAWKKIDLLTLNHAYFINRPDEAEDGIESLDDFYFEMMEDDLSSCKSALELINGTFQFQKPYCESRKNIFELLNWSIILILVCISFLIGKKAGKHEC